MSDTPRTDALLSTITKDTLPDVFGAQLIQHACILERELAAAIAQRDKAPRESDAMDEFLGAAAKREKEAAAIINSLTADINITVPFRDYTEMSPVDCYELGMMDGVAALKSQINAAIDAAMKACGKL
jgi:hypothetical protein